MPKQRKRKANNVQKHQATVVYATVIRPRSKRLSLFDNQLLSDAFLPNEKIKWERTSNCTIYEKSSLFYIRVLRRPKAESINGARVSSVGYTSEVEAENSAFQFRYELESLKTKNSLDEYKRNLRLCLSGAITIAESSTQQQIESKSKQPSNISPVLIKRYALSSNLIANKKVTSSINPRNQPPNSSILLHSDILELCANRIQRTVKSRDVRRSAIHIKKTMQNQAHRVSMTRYLSKFLSTNTCHHLLLGSDDQEIVQSFTPFDKKHVALKARHIADALQIMIDACENETPVRWIQCCEIATEKNYKVVKQGRTVANWYLQLHETTELRFKRSNRGRDSFHARSPFAEDELLLVQFKSWARIDLEHLSIKKSQDFINSKLLADWTAQQLSVYKISYPVTEYIVARWMKEAGFRYEKHKKSYYVDRHEDPDVVSDRKSYLTQFFADELYEHCWVQLTLRKYTSLKNANELQTIRIKKEEKDGVDLVSVMNQFIEHKCTHFYNDGDIPMVEVHIDNMYRYSDLDDTHLIPPLGILGGSTSVRLPLGTKPRITFGQDEAIFRSSQLNESCWTVDGESTLRTKGLGIGIMVSAFVSREYGFGMDISEAQLVDVNESRKNKAYTDAEAAIYLFGSSDKKALTESPFVRYLNYGSGKDGYWTYRHMVIQIEDCLDAFCTLHPQYDVQFELDHSSGHNMERPDGLSTTSGVINMGWGGKQRNMRRTVLGENDVGAIIHERLLKVGGEQSMVFNDINLPPIFP